MAEPNDQYRDEPPSYRPPALDDPQAIRDSVREKFDVEDDDRPSASPTDLTSDDKLWGMLAHFAGLVASAVGGISVLGPILVMLIKKDMPFVQRHAKEALNFHINMMLWGLGLVILTFVTFGLAALLFFPFGIYVVVMSVLAGLKANKGEEYQYPAIFRLVK